MKANFYAVLSTHLKMLLCARARATKGEGRLSVRYRCPCQENGWIPEHNHPHVHRPELLSVVHTHARAVHQAHDFVGVVVVRDDSHGSKSPGGISEAVSGFLGQCDTVYSGRPSKYFLEAHLAALGGHLGNVGRVRGCRSGGGIFPSRASESTIRYAVQPSDDEVVDIIGVASLKNVFEPNDVELKK